MITATASSPSLPTNPLMSVADGAVTANPALVSGVTPTPEGFSNTLNLQINLLVQPTTDISTLTPATVLTTPTIATTILAATTDVDGQNVPVVKPEIMANPANQVVTPENVLFQTQVQITQNPQLANTNSVATSELTMSAADTEILSNVNDTLKFISSGSKLGDTLPTGKAVQLPTANSATPLTQKTVQSAVQQAVTNTQVSTPAAVLAQQAMPVQTHVVQQTVTPETIAPQTQTPVVQAQTPVVQAQTPVVQAQTPVVQAQTPVVQAQTPVVQQTVTTKTDKQADTKTDKNSQAEPILVAEMATPIVLQNVIEPEKAVVEQAKQDTPKPDTQTAPIIAAQQVAPENVTPIVTAQAAPTEVTTETVVFETEHKAITPDEKPTLTPAKNLLMEAVANRSNTNGNSTNSNNGGNAPLQTEKLANAVVDNKTGATDSKSFASLLTAEKSEGISASTTAPSVDKAAPQNVAAAVNKLVQDTKVDVPAMTRPLTHPAWNQEMGERIVWMNNQGISSAEIKMNPQNMGPITVRIDMNQDQATIAFTAQNSDVRTALEASIPKLREMLNSQNVNLADVNVSQQSSTSTNSDSNRSQQQAAQMAADASANGQGNRQNNPEVGADGNTIRQTGANGEEIAVDDFANGHVLETNGANGLLSVFA
jgi:hypothetical protein